MVNHAWTFCIIENFRQSHRVSELQLSQHLCVADIFFLFDFKWMFAFNSLSSGFVFFYLQRLWEKQRLWTKFWRFQDRLVVTKMGIVSRTQNTLGCSHQYTKLVQSDSLTELCDMVSKTDTSISIFLYKLCVLLRFLSDHYIITLWRDTTHEPILLTQILPSELCPCAPLTRASPRKISVLCTHKKKKIKTELKIK